jgi:hypothetical protein
VFGVDVAVVVSVVVMALPAGLTTYHLPPNAVAPWPLTSPGSESSAKWYSGWPLQVTCVASSALMLVPSRYASSPVECGLPVVVSGGQAVAQAPLQVEVEPVSAWNR